MILCRKWSREPGKKKKKESRSALKVGLKNAFNFDSYAFKVFILHLSSPEYKKKKKKRETHHHFKVAINAKLETLNETKPLKMKQQAWKRRPRISSSSPHRHSKYPLDISRQCRLKAIGSHPPTKQWKWNRTPNSEVYLN